MFANNSILIYDNNSHVVDLIISTLECYGFSNYKFALSIHELKHLLDHEKFDFVVCSDGDNQKKIISEAKSVQVYTFILPEVLDGVSSILDNFISLNNTDLSLSSELSKYVPISLSLLKKINIIPAELFVKISEDKILKIFNQGDLFTDTEFQKYKMKGVSSLYIRSLDFLEISHQIEKDILTSISDPSLPKEQKFINIHSNIMSIVETYDLSEGLVELTKTTINHFLQETQKQKNLYNAISHILEDSSSYLSKHAILSAHLACGLANLLDWKSDLTFYKLTLAAFFANCRLPQYEVTSAAQALHLNYPTVLKQTNQETIYQDHPIEASKVIQKFFNIPPDVDKIVLEHHEKPDGTGFPRGLFHSNISPFGAILIIASDVADKLILAKDQGGDFEYGLYERYMKDQGYSKGQFKKILDVVAKLETL